jgi:hypothetical protein
MKRRDFLAASGAAAAAGLAVQTSGARADAKAAKQFLELRLYRMRSAEKRDAFLKFLAEAAVPAWNRMGIEPVGVFTIAEKDKKNLQDLTDNDLYVLLPHNSAESMALANAKLATDKKFLAAGEAILTAPKKDPAYERMEVQLMLAFDGIPKVETPAKGKGRIFQLRIYESHSLLKGVSKVEMFNTGGELETFRETGMAPVFFGESLAGTLVPNLTYMLGFENEDAQKKAWAAFMKHPTWLRIKKLPKYRDTVSRISNILLKPAACSQI